MGTDCPTLAANDVDALVISVLPDICWTPLIPNVLSFPIPYVIIARLTASVDLAQQVRQNKGSLATFTTQSYITNVCGDEGGKDGGIFSGVNLGSCHPIDFSSTVRAQGRFIVAHDATFAMNCNGQGTLNTIGRLIYVKYVSGTAVEVHPEQVGWWSNPNVGQAFENKLFQIAEKYQFNPYLLMAIMDRETGGTFAPNQVQGGNGNGRGLIQFDNSLPDMYAHRTSNMRALADAAIASHRITQAELDDFAKRYRSDSSLVPPGSAAFTKVNDALVAEVMNLTATQQLSYVEIYLDRKGITPGSPTSFDQLVSAVNHGLTDHRPYLNKLIEQLNAEYKLMGLDGTTLSQLLSEKDPRDPKVPHLKPVTDEVNPDQLDLAGLFILDTQNLSPCTGAKISFPKF